MLIIFSFFIRIISALNNPSVQFGQRLCHLTNQWRIANGLTSFNLSYTMNFISLAHLENLLVNNHDPFNPTCNLHSWYRQEITGTLIDNCCYPRDKCMIDSARKITSLWQTPYLGSVAENAFARRASGFGAFVSAEQVIDAWLASSLHRQTMMVPDLKACGAVLNSTFNQGSITTIALMWVGIEADLIPISYTGLPNLISQSTGTPTGFPTRMPTGFPTRTPTSFPTRTPNSFPTRTPTGFPTRMPTGFPTRMPIGLPTRMPTGFPTRMPTGFPTRMPIGLPTRMPTGSPTRMPTGFPTRMPTGFPTRMPTGSPTRMPIGLPTRMPTGSPTGLPNLNNDVVVDHDQEQQWSLSIVILIFFCFLVSLIALIYCFYINWLKQSSESTINTRAPAVVLDEREVFTEAYLAAIRKAESRSHYHRRRHQRNK